MNNIATTIESEVLTWSGVTAEPHRFGGIEFRVNNHEIGHLHGDYLADLPFSVRDRQELVAAGRAKPHHIYPNSGWVSYYIQGVEDVPCVVDLFLDILPSSRGVGILPLSPIRISGSASPLKLNPLRYLTQRWFSPQTFTPFQKSVTVCPTVQFKPKYLVFWYLVHEHFT